MIEKPECYFRKDLHNCVEEALKKHLFVSNDKSMTCFRSFFGFFTTASHSNSKGLHKTHKIISSCMYFFLSFFVKRVCLHFGYRLLIGCISGTGSQLIFLGKKLVFSTGNQLILAFFLEK